MKIKNLWLFSTGILILLFLFLSYFIKIEIDSGFNFKEITPLLGVLIFHNIFVLIVYIAIALFLIYKGLKIKIV